MKRTFELPKLTDIFKIKANFNVPIMKKKILSIPVFLILFNIQTLMTFAQEEAEAPAAAAKAPATLLEQIINSGVWMVPLVIASLAVIVLYVYNFIQLSAKKFNPPQLKADMFDHMQNCRVRSALEVASKDNSFLGRMLARALPKVDATDPETLGKSHFQDECADFSINESREYMTWIGYFSLIAQAAPMLGLLGTVAGMIGAFATLGTSGQADPSQLAGDISTALITTASGLVIALPAIIGFTFFKNKLAKMIADAQETGDDLLNASIATVNADQILAKVPEGLQN